LDSHIEKILDTCSSTIELIEHLKNPDLLHAEKLYKRVSINERSADHIQDELANEIARGILPPEISEKLFRLIRLADSTANYSKSSSKDLLLLLKLNIQSTQFEAIIEYLKEIAQLTFEGVKVFRKMVASLGIDDQIILDNRQIIEDREREADNVHMIVREEIFTINESVGIPAYFLLIDAAKNLENASDCITHAADILYMIVMLGTPS
jgi:predicted phosphate transport protein (TIGR00153 family)